MTVLAWVLFGVAAYVVVVGLLLRWLCPVLRSNAEAYPLPEQGRTDLLDRLDRLERWDS